MARNLHRLIALCLLLVWGPATMCCALDAAGAESLCASETCHSPDKEKAPGDGCNVLESGDYQSVFSTTKVAPSATFICACLICLRADVEKSAEVVAVELAAIERPRNWTVRWHFERRAAALAHAPDSLTV